MKTTIKFYGSEITLSGLKKECEVINSAFDKLQRIKQYQLTYSGVKKEGIEPEGTLFQVMFGSNQLRDGEGFTAKIEGFKTRIPAIVTLEDVKSLHAEMKEIFNAHVCIVDDRITEEQKAEQETERQNDQEERERQALEIQKLVNLNGEAEVTRGVNDMFLTIQAYFNDSYSMVDYFHPHHSIGGAYAIGIVSKGARKESLVRDIIAAVPELQAYEWNWNIQEYSNGHGTFMESSQVGIAPIKAYDGRKEVGYWYEISFSNAITLPKSRLFVEQVPQPKGKIEGAAPSGNKIATCKINQEKKGIELYFNSKPASAVLDDLKANGWRWSRFNSCWYKLDNSIARRTASKYAEVPNTLNASERLADAGLVEAQEEAAIANGNY